MKLPTRSSGSPRLNRKVRKLYLPLGGRHFWSQRPAFDALCRDATKSVMVWSVDRLGRSLKDLVAFLSELHALRIDLFLHQ